MPFGYQIASQSGLLDAVDIKVPRRKLTFPVVRRPGIDLAFYIAQLGTAAFRHVPAG
jgi:hypothetical protein